MPRLPKIYRHFFDSCQSSAFRQIYQTKKAAWKKSSFFDFEESGKKLKKLEKFLFPSFLRLVRYKYYSRKLLQFISKTNPKNIRLFMRKKAPFSGFRNGEWKLKKGYPFSSFECEIQRNTLIFRHFSFSSSAFFAKSRIARSDHWLYGLWKTVSEHLKGRHLLVCVADTVPSEYKMV